MQFRAKKTCALLLILIQFTSAFTQGKRDYQWRFGNYAGVSFSGGAPVSTGSSMSTAEGNATISDTSGNHLFYTNGVNVWAAANNIMPNGAGLLGSNISDQSALIVPSPGNSNQYYIFTVPNWDDPNRICGLAYSIVDMTLNGGAGDVTAVKNVIVDQTSWEQLTALMSSDGQKIWIVTHDYNSQNFRSYLLTASGFSTVPVTSAVGAVYSGSNRFGELHFSKACNPKLVSVLGSAYTVNETVQLFDFDMSTGTVSNVQTLATYNNIPGAYGCAFSPDNTKLYVTQYNSSAIYQFDLTNANIASTLTNISPSNFSIASTVCQAPDGKLYLSMNGQGMLSAIQFPNTPGVGCNFQNNVLSLGGGRCTLALPNFPTPTWSVFAATDTIGASCGMHDGYAIAVPTPYDTTNTYLWSTGATTDTLAHIGAGIYTVTVTDAGGCSASATAYVTTSGAGSASTLTINGTDTFCSGTFPVYTANEAGNNNPIQYQWQINHINAGTNSTQFSSNSFMNGDTISCFMTYSGCTGHDTAFSNNIIITILNNPVVNTGPDVFFCTGQSDTLGGPPIAGYTYSWNPGNGLSNPTISNPVVTGTNPTSAPINGGYTLTVSDGHCSAESTVWATVYPWVHATLNFTSPSCGQSNGGIRVVASPAFATPYTYIWNTGSTSDSISALPSALYTVTVTDTVGCTASAAVHLNNVNPPQTTIQITGNNNICAGTPDSFISHITHPAGSAQFQWFLNGVLVSNDSLFSSSLLQNNDTISCDYIYIGCGGSDTAGSNKIIVQVASMPVSNAGPDVAFCNGDSAAIGAAPINGYSYLWIPTGGLSNSTISNPFAKGANTIADTLTTNYVLRTDNGICAAYDTVTVTIYPALTATFTPASPQCLLNNSFIFNSGAPYFPGENLNWNFGPGALPSTSALPQQIVNFTTSGVHVVSLTINNGTCGNSVYTDSVIVYSMPVANFVVADTAMCAGNAVCFTNLSVAENPASYVWTYGDGGTSTAENPCYTYTKPGNYNVQLSVTSAQGCITDTIVNNAVIVYPPVVAAFEPSDATLLLPADTITFLNQSVGAISYSWNWGLGTSTALNPGATFPLVGTYPVILKAYNALGCADSVEHYVTVIPPADFFIPNVFTPNGDGMNDVFFVQKQQGVTVLKFEVFDRWGEKVYDGLFGWDGTFKGKPCQPDVYVYYIELQLADNVQAIKRKGSITLLR